MTVTLNYGQHTLTITTDHGASSYGQPVVCIDGDLTDIPVSYEPDEPYIPSALQQLADAAGIWEGVYTRVRLEHLADEMYPDGISTGAQADAVIAEFRRQGAALSQQE
jgi:hypothetical protein